ncbi:hypothetical protein Tco_1308844, partial [Tanacetum coccineum]
IHNLNNSVSHANEGMRNTVTTNPSHVSFHTGPTYPAGPPYSIGPYHPGNTGTITLSGQATTFPHAFTVGMLHDPTSGAWNMDTGGDVLRRLVSSNFISYNKEKPPILCHACQLGKHARLPFVSSSTVISSCFDIIHSDVWTSPIPSLSGFKYYVLFLDHYS